MGASQRAIAHLHINLDKIVQNWRRIGTMVGPATRVAGVVKADSYGLGADRVAPALAWAGCRDFFVATIDEGLALRPLLPRDAFIYVLGGPLPGTESDFTAHHLVPVLNSPGQIALWRDHARRQGQIQKAVLHLDTGMSRLGLEPMTQPDLSGLDILLVMSHLACPDEPDHPMNRHQHELFHGFCRHLDLAAPLSLAASSGIFLGADYHFQMVRPGAALYGLNPQPGHPNPMAQPVTLTAPILQVRDVDSPQSVGYGASHRVSGRAKIATIGLGYADGLLRSLGNRGLCYLGGKQVPVVGRISMDLITIDVTAIQPDQAVPGAVIELIGPHQTADDLAAQAGTIGYEMLTALSRRAHRTYISGNA